MRTATIDIRNLLWKISAEYVLIGIISAFCFQVSAQFNSGTRFSSRPRSA